MTQTCRDCHGEFEHSPSAWKTLRCPACREIRQREIKREWARKHRSRRQYHRPSRQSECVGQMEAAIYTAIDIIDLIHEYSTPPARLIGHLRGGVNVEYMERVRAEIEGR